MDVMVIHKVFLSGFVYIYLGIKNLGIYLGKPFQVINCLIKFNLIIQHMIWATGLEVQK